MRKITEIIVHCSATPAGRQVTVADIDRWHRQRGWAGIGYHYVIYLDGSIHAGRALNRIGAHCLRHNAQSIGICYIGGTLADCKTPADTRTDAQRTALATLIASLRERFGPLPVYGHRNFAHKACPCFDAPAEFPLP